MGLLAKLQPESIFKWTFTIGPHSGIKAGLESLLALLPLVIAALILLRLGLSGISVGILLALAVLLVSYGAAFLLVFYLDTISRMSRIGGAIGIFVCLFILFAILLML